jgi:hypothetical protein
MKGSKCYLGMVMGSMLLVVVVTTTYISGGFQILWEDPILIGIVGSIFMFISVPVGLMVSVRGHGCSILVRWHKHLVSDRANRISRIIYLLISRSSCKSCPLVSLCLGS